MPSIYFPVSYSRYKEHINTVCEKANSQLQKTTFQHSHHHSVIEASFSFPTPSKIKVIQLSFSKRPKQILFFFF